jgi:hypothetical protein
MKICVKKSHFQVSKLKCEQALAVCRASRIKPPKTRLQAIFGCFFDEAMRAVDSLPSCACYSAPRNSVSWLEFNAAHRFGYGYFFTRRDTPG